MSDKVYGKFDELAVIGSFTGSGGGVSAITPAIGVLYVTGGNATVTATDQIHSVLELRQNDGSISSANNTAAKICAYSDLSNGAYAGMSFYTARGGEPTEKARITSAGNLLVGTTTDNGAKVQVSGSMSVSALPVYADNTAAAALATGMMYRTATGVVMVKY